LALMAAMLWPVVASAAPPTQQVLVTNTHKEPVPVRVMTDEGFQHWFALDFADGVGTATSSYTVPADKRLVIEYASMVTYLPADGQSMYLWVSTTAGDGYGTSALNHALQIQQREDYGLLKQFGAAHLVRLYANPGTTVRVTMGRFPYNGLASGMVTLSGRLETLP
jgi:hypothetical protein